MTGPSGSQPVDVRHRERRLSVSLLAAQYRLTPSQSAISHRTQLDTVTRAQAALVTVRVSRDV